MIIFAVLMIIQTKNICTMEEKFNDFTNELKKWVNEKNEERGAIVITFDDFEITSFINGTRRSLVQMIECMLLDERISFDELVKEATNQAERVKEIMFDELDEHEELDKHFDKNGKILS